MKTTCNIIQIIPPTPGWALVYRDDGGEGKCFFLRPLAFALIETTYEDGKKIKDVAGINPLGQVADQTINYMGLVYLGNDMDKLDEMDELPPNSMIEL